MNAEHTPQAVSLKGFLLCSRISLVERTSLSKKKPKGKTIGAMIILGITLIALVYNFRGLFGLTVLNITQLEVDPQGYEDVAGKWRGSYWVINVAVTQIDTVAGTVTLQNETETNVVVNETAYNLKTASEVKIVIDPQDPYMVRKIKKADEFGNTGDIMVTPRTYRSFQNKLLVTTEIDKSVSVDPLWLTRYDWAEPTWRIYTPFRVRVYKDGVEITDPNNPVVLDAEGADKVQIIPTSEGNIRVEHLGSLSGTYMDPQTPSQIAFLSKSFVYDWTQIAPYVPYDRGVEYDPTGLVGNVMQRIRDGSSDAYSLYWYGRWYRWTQEYGGQTPAGFQTEWWGAAMIQPWDGTVGYAWTVADDAGAYKRDPVRPVIFPKDKSSLPQNYRSMKCLTEWLEQNKGATNLATSATPIFSAYDYWTLDTVNNEVKLGIPWGAYQMPYVQIRVPTEMADTWVDRPPISNVQPTATWARTGTKDIDIYGTERLKVDLYQSSNVRSTTVVKAVSTDPDISIYPLERSPTIDPGDTVTVYFDVTNLGVTAEKTGSILIICYETYSGQETGRDTVNYRLPPIQHETTTMRLHVIDTSDQNPTGNQGVAGITVQIQYPPSTGTTKQGFTDQNGIIEFSLGTQYSGEVYIQTMATMTYKPSYRTVTVQPGLNEFTIELVRQGENEEGNLWPTIAAIIGLSTIGAVGIMVYKHKKEREMP